MTEVALPSLGAENSLSQTRTVKRYLGKPMNEIDNLEQLLTFLAFFLPAESKSRTARGLWNGLLMEKVDASPGSSSSSAPLTSPAHETDLLPRRGVPGCESADGGKAESLSLPLLLSSLKTGYASALIIVTPSALGRIFRSLFLAASNSPLIGRISSS